MHAVSNLRGSFVFNWIVSIMGGQYYRGPRNRLFGMIAIDYCDIGLYIRFPISIYSSWRSEHFSPFMMGWRRLI